MPRLPPEAANGARRTVYGTESGALLAFQPASPPAQVACRFNRLTPSRRRRHDWSLGVFSRRLRLGVKRKGRMAIKSTDPKAGRVYVQCLTTAVAENWELLSFSTSQFGVRRIVVVAGAPTAGWSVRVWAFAQIPKVSRLRLQENWELLYER